MSMSQVGSGLPRLLAERYELVEQLASGSMTSVWRGHDRVLGRDVVVKVLHPDLAADAALRGSFHQEAVNAARLTHPNIVALYDTGEQQGVNYIVMELVDGPTLRDVLNTRGPLPPAKAARLASEVVHALEYAHQAGVLHRNLKPTNILLCDDGSVKVADFSLAKATGEDPTRTGELAAGGYLAPEAADGGSPDGRSDVYGLGACLFEMLTGRPPMTRTSPRGNTGPLSPRAIRAGVPRELDAVVLRAMMVDPRDRYPTAAAMGSALARTAAGDGDRTPLLVREPPALPPSVGEAPQAPGFLRHEGRWLGWTLVVVGLVAALVVVGASLNSKGVISLPGTHQAPARTSPPTTGQPAATLPIAQAQAYDPFGKPPKENDVQAPRAIDGDAQSAWETEHYRSQDFGRLKQGVGLVLDLGSPQQARQLDLRLLYGGSSIEVYGSDSAPSSFDAWSAHRLANQPDVPRNATIDFAGDASYQYYLIWFTQLPASPDGGGFQDGIAEATLRP
jgi:eukaryotic-like serine/threonine-protein kinase